MYKIFFQYLIIFFIFFNSTNAFPRAGGAGGGRSRSSFSRSSSGSRSFGRSYWRNNNYSNSNPTSFGVGDYVELLVLVILVIVILTLISKRNQNKFRESLKSYNEENEKNQNPQFDINTNIEVEKDLINKVKTAYFSIQEAWSLQNIQKARRFISDGVYQRYNVQIEMMKLLGQVNNLSSVRIRSLSIIEIVEDGLYEIAQVKIDASMIDQFVCEKIPELNSDGGYEECEEIWSFIRKRNGPKKDIYSNNNCPQCSANLPASLGDSCKCQYCGVLVNSGEYDWVLSEISQVDDFEDKQNKESINEKLNQKIQGLYLNHPDFTKQIVEDKASNAFMQWLSANVKNNPNSIKKFCSKQYFDKYIEISKNEQRFKYNRLYLNTVELIDVMETSKNDALFFEMRYSFQRVELNNKIKLIDPCITSDTKILCLVRDKMPKENKGSIFANLCGCCGASIKETIEPKCPYCNTVVNSTKYDWVVYDIMSIVDYRDFRAKTKHTTKNSEILIDLKGIQDFVINNLVVMAVADGKIEDSEKIFLEEIAEQFSINKIKLNQLIQSSLNNKLSIRFPLDQDLRNKMYVLMKEMAEKDGEVSEKEKEILNHIEKNIFENKEV